MIDYVIEHNPDDRILTKASRILHDGGLLCFPTETNWVVVCDPFNKTAVDKLYQLRHIDNSKHLTVLCANFQMASEIALISDSAFALMKKVVPGPYTFIFQAQKKIQKFLKASRHDHQVGIRFPPKNLCRSVIEHYGHVVLSTHLNAPMLELEEGGFIYSALIEEQFGNQIDLILDPGEVEFVGSTSIIDFTDEVPEVVREGAGDVGIFLV